MNAWKLYFDGSCQPCNPGGHACFGWILLAPDGSQYKSGNGYICSGDGATNNVAEYWGLIAGLDYMKRSRLKGNLKCFGDSLLVVNQISNRWKCKKSHLRKLRDEVRDLLSIVSHCWSLNWIPRDENQEADFLSTSVLIPIGAQIKASKKQMNWLQRKGLTTVHS